MIERVRNVVGATVIAAAVVVTPIAGASASAAPVAVPEAQISLANGLVTVQIVDAVDVTNNRILQNVNVGVAANALVQACNIAVSAAVLAVQRVDQTGQQYTCSAGSQTATVTQDAGNRGGR
jgi:hypothetical protein